MSPREATSESMQEISVALVAIALVLSAVFLPMAFFGGSTGVIYRQFSVTIVSAMVLSVGVALVLTPALTAHLLRPRREQAAGSERSAGGQDARKPMRGGSPGTRRASMPASNAHATRSTAASMPPASTMCALRGRSSVGRRCS